MAVSVAVSSPVRLMNTIPCCAARRARASAIGSAPVGRSPSRYPSAASSASRPPTLGIIGEVETAPSGWRQVAADLGIPHHQADLMAVAHESGQRAIARALNGAISGSFAEQ